MRKLLLFSSIFILGINVFAQNGNTITISGQVTDFDGNPIDSCLVRLCRKNFSSVYVTYSEKTGYYTLKDVEKGYYMALMAIRPEEYPRPVFVKADEVVSDEKKRLEYWAWNVIADKDLTINPRYGRLELYGFQVFEVFGGTPYLMAYVRPGSLGKMLSFDQKEWSDKKKMEKTVDVSVEAKDIEFKIYAGDEQLSIHSIQTLDEYVGDSIPTFRGFFLQFDRPKEFSDNYCIFRIEATHKLFGEEKGENVYFYELKDYK